MTSERVSKRTDSEQALISAKAWLDCCLTDHPEDGWCSSEITAKLPRRVVDIGDESIKLVETVGEVDSYICLSHCWGPAQIITTTRETLEERKRQIRPEDLSQTFKDAVEITRRLGVRYIWIDSLCILQGDKEDWAAEGANMANIYRNAYLTIAATRGRGGQDGLFGATPDSEVAGTTPTGEPFSLFFRERIDHKLSFETGSGGEGPAAHFRESSSKRFPLLTRAWVLQERLLSPRVLHFGPYELFWECHAAVCCECDGIRSLGRGSQTPLPAPKLLHSSAVDPLAGAGVPTYFVQRAWRTIVADYVCLDLTVPTDRLPALGGLARNIAEKRSRRYVAGLFEDSLSDDLLWYVTSTPAGRKPRASTWRAPSWSWASVDGMVSYRDLLYYWDDDIEYDDQEDFTHFAKIEEVGTIATGVDEFGELGGGFLRVSGLTATAVVERRAADNGGVTFGACFADGSALDVFPDYDWDISGIGHLPPGSEVICLRMSRLRAGPDDYWVWLVFRRASQNGDKHERVGALHVVTKVSEGGSAVSDEGIHHNGVEQILEVV